MTEESNTSSNAEDSIANTADASQSRQRKRRKWDQPAESLVSAGVASLGVPGAVVPLANMNALAGISLHGLVPSVNSSPFLSNQLLANSATIPTAFYVPSTPQITATGIPKLNQPKIQDELMIAREIVINDAESSVRYKLTKRQTQEEVQRYTGAVVITRGKYRPPNAPPDGEKPLYLHISSGAHLKDTAERILAVDRAAAIVEDMLKQGPNLQPALSVLPMTGASGAKALSTCVFLGFDADKSLNIAARIRGPNDQYINHIMNETGATVVLKGRGSGNFELPNTGEAQQPLHLFLSADNLKSLEDAKRLAENLLDTIGLECGTSRISCNKVYSAVPPPQQLLSGVQSSGIEEKVNTSPAGSFSLSTISSSLFTPASPVAIPATGSIFSQGGVVNYGPTQPTVISHPKPLVNGGTSYSGYGGIYPQATPLQQVALALRHSTSPITSTVAPTASLPCTAPTPAASSTPEKENRPSQRRKFQELPAGSKDPSTLQVSESVKPGEQTLVNGVRNISTLLAPKKSVQSSSNGMLPPSPRMMPESPSMNGTAPHPQRTMSKPPLSNAMLPPSHRTMPPPPPPPKFYSSNAVDKLHEKNTISNKSKAESIPDTLAKLVEYGEEDDDPDENEESDLGNSSVVADRKPFWAL
ncbi:protein RIK isoform X2 [Mercurialis annua]|uniref:protein RIK isoform X2 n=1 Tax=Mercurialis annua TaxID=3986 RepID=UPI00215F8D27|nr:protein RIK isoform X2 [Mercurialis annua]